LGNDTPIHLGRSDKQNDKVMVGIKEQENYILNYYDNNENKKKYCIAANDHLNRFGEGYAHYTGLQNNLFGKRYIPRGKKRKCKILYDFTVEYAKRELHERMLAEQQANLNGVDA
jgi:hypothetical protein